nr:uncharacterized protein LOC6637003 isoform X2 [Drosophila virilis]
MIRKHLAICTSMLNVKDFQIDRLANFMGHHKDIHKEIYRIPVTVAEIAEVSQMLMAALGNNVEDKNTVALDQFEEKDSESDYSEQRSESDFNISDDDIVEKSTKKESAQVAILFILIDKVKRDIALVKCPIVCSTERWPIKVISTRSKVLKLYNDDHCGVVNGKNRPK